MYKIMFPCFGTACYRKEKGIHVTKKKRALEEMF